MGKDKKDKKKDKDKKDKKEKKDKKKDRKEKKSSDATDAVAAAPPPVAPPETTAMCREHNTSAVELYCVTCERSICRICRDTGFHREVFHMCRDLSLVYRERVGMLRDMVDGRLNPKRGRFEDQVDKISGIIEKIRQAKLEVTLETKRDSDGMLQRLSDEEARKMSILNVELTNLRSDIQKMDEIEQHTRNIPQDSHTIIMTRFLERFPSLQEEAHFLGDKRVKTEYAVNPSDFPREVESRQKMLEQYSSLLTSHKVKDDMISYLLEERKRLLDQCEEQEEYISRVEEATRTEMQNWMGLTDRFVSSLESFKLKCVYCSVPLSGDVINTFCEANVADNTHLEEVEVAAQSDDYGAKSSGLHYFVKFG